MISVYFGNDKSAVLNIDVFFNNVFYEEWLDDPLVREMIKDVDNSDVLSNQCIQSPVLGQIPPERLSGGVKALICLYKMDDFLVDLIVCGENCEKWISKISQLKDIRVSMSGYDLTFKGLEISGVCENDGSLIRNSEDWTEKMLDMVGEICNER